LAGTWAFSEISDRATSARPGGDGQRAGAAFGGLQRRAERQYAREQEQATADQQALLQASPGHVFQAGSDHGPGAESHAEGGREPLRELRKAVATPGWAGGAKLSVMARIGGSKITEQAPMMISTVISDGRNTPVLNAHQIPGRRTRPAPDREQHQPGHERTAAPESVPQSSPVHRSALRPRRARRLRKSAA
jgi:hypothetical protein